MIDYSQYLFALDQLNKLSSLIFALDLQVSEAESIEYNLDIVKSLPKGVELKRCQIIKEEGTKRILLICDY